MSEHEQQDRGEYDNGPAPGGIDLAAFTKSLIGDLANLRTGKISVQQARASAELARQVIRSMHLIVTAQRLIESRALPTNKPAGNNEG